MKKWFVLMGVFLTNLLSASQIVILLGPPGAGKGTHAKPLSDTLHIPHISTGDLFRAHLENKTPLGKKAQAYIQAGKLVPDQLVIDILQSRVSKSDCKNGYILDGFPRTYAQAKILEKQLNKEDHLSVIYLDAPEKVLIERISGRISCVHCGAIFHQKYLPPASENQCDHCQNKLTQRKDDAKEVVKKRLKVYHAQTKPLIQYYKTRGLLKTFDVNDGRKKEEIFQEIMQIFSSHASLHN